MQLSIHWPVKELKNRFCVSLERRPLPWVEGGTENICDGRPQQRHTSVCVCRVEKSVTYRSFRGSALPVYFFLSLSTGHVVIYKQAAAQAETKLSFLFNKSSCVAENPLSLFASLHFNHFHHSLFNSETQRCALLLGHTHKNDILCTTASANEMINE